MVGYTVLEIGMLVWLLVGVLVALGLWLRHRGLLRGRPLVLAWVALCGLPLLADMLFTMNTDRGPPAEAVSRPLLPSR